MVIVVVIKYHQGNDKSMETVLMTTMMTKKDLQRSLLVLARILDSVVQASL